MKKFRRKVFNALESKSSQSLFSKGLGLFIIILIILNMIAIILQSVPSINNAFEIYFYWFEISSVIIFSIEYLTRIWCIVENPKYSHPISGRIRYIFSFMAIIDLLAILPFYAGFIKIDMRFLRILRVFRLFRILKIARYTYALQLMVDVFAEKKEQLIVSLVMILVLLIFISSLMYFVENPAQPHAFSSIPETMWWGVATLTTVGYGDVYPITGIGKLLGGLIAILSIGLFAIPTGVLASGFSSAIEKGKSNSANQ